MDPSVMQQAMAAMNRMTPAQLAAMQEQVANLPANVIAEQMQAFQSMTPEQQRFAASQAARMNPADMLSQQQHSTQHLNAAQKLKGEGNSLHGLRDYKAAAEKYEAAKRRLEGDATREAEALKKACNLNLASCYLNLGAANQCIETCNIILAADPRNCKALFRRGQAYHTQGRRERAIADLKQAVQNASEHDGPIIQAKLEEISAGIQITEVESSSDQSDSEPASTSATPPEEEADVPPTKPLASEAVPSTRTSSPSADVQHPSLPPELGSAAMDMMRNMPIEDLQTMARSMQGHSASQNPHEQAAAMMKDPAMMKMAMRMMESMPPEQMQNLARNFQASGASGPSGVSGPSANLPQQPDIAAMAKDPAMMQTMQEMMKNLSPEDLVAMSQQAGLKLSPEQATQMQDQMQRLSPEQMQKLLWVAGSMQRVMQFLRTHIMLCVSLCLLFVALLWKVFF